MKHSPATITGTEAVEVEAAAAVVARVATRMGLMVVTGMTRSPQAALPLVVPLKSALYTVVMAAGGPLFRF